MSKSDRDDVNKTGKTADHSAGDSREPFSEEGGVDARHAKTHDVAREKATNSTPQVDEPDEFADDLKRDNRTS